ncbi:hypothetical protein O2N63_13080 [Aliiroseovarius sp. KMU-50]|uniref:Replication initiation factor domain-containing protein n=1 Tax=Aliiroseovarius salicola TaxID=3009082 RepID=A0ABT4W3C8_9RHOB|nr:hypothetical protein [Aliiroseovarius sp. KMU-50]MDA5095017.1 hypothetical protein [Aliiroseovarius sp. KMU-50]
MEILHKGFDGLDIAFEGQIPSGLDRELLEAKTNASETKTDTLLKQNGVWLQVADSGARGGYAYRCDTGPLGAIWFFKRPNPKDPWGIRVSLKSLPLAKHGLGWARHYIPETLKKLDIEVSSHKMAISRVDYAIDILAPAFVLDRHCFIAHARSKLKSHDEIEVIQEVGHSGRTTSVTVGSNPGQQVILYDKREEVLSKPDKCVWWDIWNASRQKLGLEPLERNTPEKSRVWRVEFRAHKRHLKDNWKIRTWDDFDQKVGDVFLQMSKAIRYVNPTADTNRSRWQDAPIWKLATEQIQDDLAEMKSDLSCDKLKTILMDQQRQLLLSQYLGLGVSLAALEGIEGTSFDSFLSQTTENAKRLSKCHKKPISKRIEAAAAKYALLRAKYT